jgi:hypothetical protein
VGGHGTFSGWGEDAGAGEAASGDVAIEPLVPKDHRVRAVWAFIDRLDLAPLYAKIRAVDPKLLRGSLLPWNIAILLGLPMLAVLQIVAVKLLVPSAGP